MGAFPIDGGKERWQAAQPKSGLVLALTWAARRPRSTASCCCARLAPSSCSVSSENLVRSVLHNMGAYTQRGLGATATTEPSHMGKTQSALRRPRQPGPPHATAPPHRAVSASSRNVSSCSSMRRRAESATAASCSSSSAALSACAAPACSCCCAA